MRIQMKNNIGINESRKGVGGYTNIYQVKLMFDQFLGVRQRRVKDVSQDLGFCFVSVK